MSKMVMGFLRLLVLAATASATVSSAGQTLVVNGISYYAAPEAVTIISATADMLSSSATGDVDLIPLTVMVDSSNSFTTDVFRSIVSNYTASDDVFNTGFLQGLSSVHIFCLGLTSRSRLSHTYWVGSSNGQISTWSCTH
jgi:hypothetical protein